MPNTKKTSVRGGERKSLVNDRNGQPLYQGDWVKFAPNQQRSFTLFSVNGDKACLLNTEGELTDLKYEGYRDRWITTPTHTLLKSTDKWLMGKDKLGRPVYQGDRVKFLDPCYGRLLLAIAAGTPYRPPSDRVYVVFVFDESDDPYEPTSVPRCRVGETDCSKIIKDTGPLHGEEVAIQADQVLANVYKNTMSPDSIRGVRRRELAEDVGRYWQGKTYRPGEGTAYLKAKEDYDLQKSKKIVAGGRRRRSNKRRSIKNRKSRRSQKRRSTFQKLGV